MLSVEWDETWKRAISVQIEMVSFGMFFIKKIIDTDYGYIHNNMKNLFFKCYMLDSHMLEMQYTVRDAAASFLYYFSWSSSFFQILGFFSDMSLPRRNAVSFLTFDIYFLVVSQMNSLSLFIWIFYDASPTLSSIFFSNSSAPCCCFCCRWLFIHFIRKLSLQQLFINIQFSLTIFKKNIANDDKISK